MKGPGRAILVLCGLLPAAVLLGLVQGSVPIPFPGVMASLLARLGLGGGGLEGPGEVILWAVRLPRTLLAGVVGGGLAVVGACLQGVFRNPLADAGLLGVGPGAALGAVVAIYAGLGVMAFAVPVAAFVGALVSVLVVYALAHAFGRPTIAGLLLTGVAVSAFAGAATSILLVATEEFRVKAVLFWLAGGLEGRGWDHARGAAALVLPGAVLLWLFARTLDALSLGEEEASSLGISVHAARLGLLALAALVAGSATAAAGSVPFVGLVAPHAARALVGSVSRRLLPASFLSGAILVILADVFTRTTVGQIELPLGSVTALVGAPYFLVALRGRAGA